MVWLWVCICVGVVVGKVERIVCWYVQKYRWRKGDVFWVCCLFKCGFMFRVFCFVFFFGAVRVLLYLCVSLSVYIVGCRCACACVCVCVCGRIYVGGGGRAPLCIGRGGVRVRNIIITL